jgi:UDPglucose 6-dehydrogenase
VAEVCGAVGADIVHLAEALAYDERIGGHFLTPGLGFGGGCLPKDVRSFRVAAQELGVGSLARMLSEVDAISGGRR